MAVLHRRERGAGNALNQRPRAHWLAATLLVILSVAAGLAVCETVLRFAHPRYAHIASARPPNPVPAPADSRSPFRTWQGTWRRPDTHERHLLLYNSLGGRQHRDFSDRDLREGVNVAFFGDSFTENRYIAAQYSFTEVLDYLLNMRTREVRSGSEAPRRVHVLNFGASGTGPGYQHAMYLDFPHKALLRHVFYVHHSNDFDNVRDSGLWAMSAGGDLLVRARPPPPPRMWGGPAAWRHLLSNLHLTYLLIDAYQRLVETVETDTLGGFRPAHRALRAGVLRWREEVEANGGAFHIVLLPDPGTARRFAEAEWPASLDVLDLGACFRDVVPRFAWEDYRFRSDWHWNELGNMVAAHCLYRFLEGKLALGRAPDAALAQARYVYYRAFADDTGWPGIRFMPVAPWVLPQQAADGEPEAIRTRYHGGTADPRRAVARALRQRPPVARAGGWEVYAAPARDLVMWVKSPCEEADPARRLFLRSFATKEDGAVVFRGDLANTPVWRDGRDCVIMAWLKRHPVAVVETGERGPNPGDATLWQVVFDYDEPQVVAAAVAAFHQRYRAFAVRRPAARARWNVYVSEAGAKLTYLKEPCIVDDLNYRFFVRRFFVRPADVRHVDGPGSAADSGASMSLHSPRRVAQMFDGKCIADIRSDHWPVQTVRTGQTDGDSVLWETTFHVDEGRFRRAWHRVRGAAPAARGLFDVHRDDGRLVYVREPCAAEDVRARFFLHVVPRDETALAAGKTAANLDFDFAEHGLLAGGRCVAMRRLPDYEIARITTGQLFKDTGKETWRVAL